MRIYNRSSLHIIALMVIIISCLCAAGSIHAQSTKLDSILALHQKALGDLDSIRALKTVSVQIKIGMNDIIGQVRADYDFPDCCHVCFDFEPLSSCRGTDGKKVWSYDFEGPVKIEDPQDIATVHTDLYLVGYLYLTRDESYGRVKLRSDTVIDETVYYQLALYPAKGDSTYLLINTESGRADYGLGFGKKLFAIYRYSDFRNVDGIETAFHQETELLEGGLRIIYDTESIMVNEPIPDSIFEVPELSTWAKNYRFVDECDSMSVGFRFKKNRIIIKGVVNGKKKFKFLLDTGGSNTLISEKMAKKLDLQTWGEFKSRGIAGKAAVNFAKIDSVQFGDVFWYPDRIHVLRGSYIFEDFDAILGYDFFVKFPTRIDFDEKQVTLYNIDSFEPAKPGSPVAIELDNRQAVKNMSLDGRPIRMVIDLGSTGAVTLFSRYKWFYKYSSEHYFDRSRYSIHGIGGSRPIKVGYAESLKFDDIFISRPVLEIAFRPEGFQEDRSTDALLGVGILKRYNLFIDYPNKLIYFDKRNKSE